MFKELALMIRQSANSVVLTGAGMDTDSNIPDFRGKGGWWRNLDPRTVASIETFNDNYPLFHEFYSMRINLLADIKPHSGHYILAELESRGMIKSIATQNVSGLHALAGNKNVYELHGNIRTARCNNCDRQAGIDDFLAQNNCSTCHTPTLRPNVVLFGESLPQNAWNAALTEIRQANLLIVIGTSLEVYPVNQFPLIAKGKTVFVNNEERGENYSFDLRLIGNAKEILDELKQELL